MASGRVEFRLELNSAFELDCAFELKTALELKSAPAARMRNSAASSGAITITAPHPVVAIGTQLSHHTLAPSR